MSRSRLYAEALRAYIDSLDEETLAQIAAESQAEYAAGDPKGSGRAAAGVLQRLDEQRLDRAIADFYNREAPPIDPAGMTAQAEVLDKEEDW